MSAKLDEETSQIVDNHILKEENTTVRRKHFFDSQKCYASLIICLFASLFITPILLISCEEDRGPRWFKTHAETTSALEAERVYGDDLLLDKLVSADTKHHYKYRSILEWEKGGSLGNRNSWKLLETKVNYYYYPNESNSPMATSSKDENTRTKPLFPIYSDSTTLAIFFKINDDPKLEFYRRNHYEHHFSNPCGNYFSKSIKNTVINGVKVTYIEDIPGKQPHLFIAKFVKGNYIYYYSFDSKQDEKSAQEILKQLLSD